MKKLIVVVLLLMALMTCGLFAANVTLAWDASCSSNVVGHVLYWSYPNPPPITNVVAAYTDDCDVFHPTTTNIYQGKYSGTTNSVFVAGTNTTCTISNLVTGQTYCFIVTARSSTGLESDWSNEAVYTVPVPNTNAPPSAVQNFKLNKVEQSTGK